MSDFRRKLMMCKKSESDLPSGYTKLNYLESTGTQYINTGLIINNHNVEIKFIRGGAATKEQVLFGGRSAPFTFGSEDFSIWTNNSGDMIGFHYAGYDSHYIKYDLVTAPVILKNKDGKFYANDELLIKIPNEKMSNSKSAFLFGLNNVGKLDERTFIGKIYYLKVWDKNDNLIMYLQPYLDKNGTPCMFDTVSRKPLYNEGTGEFLYE